MSGEEELIFGTNPRAQQIVEEHNRRAAERRAANRDEEGPGPIDLTGMHPMLAMHVARVAIVGGTLEEVEIVREIIDDHIADNAGTRDT